MVAAGGRPMQVEDNRHAVAHRQIDIVSDGVLVVGAAISSVHSIDVEPAVFVERHTNGVDVPSAHSLDRCGVVRAAEDAPTLDTCVFCAGAIDTA